MLSITLPNGRCTDRLAFGCGGLAGSKNYRESRQLLISAWEAGFRHFDVAPSYGLGEAEHYLGRFLKEIGSGAATVTSKAGIARPRAAAGASKLLMPLARMTLGSTPSIRKLLGKQARKSLVRGCFSPDAVSRSLEESLRALKVEHIDVFLMHELQEADLSDELTRLLDDALHSGKIGAIGVGSNRERIVGVAGTSPPSWRYFQTSWDWEFPALPRSRSGVSNCHGVLRNLDRFEQTLFTDPATKRRAEAALNVTLDLSQTRVDLLLSMALDDCRDGFVITQTSNPERISALRIERRVKNPEQHGQRANGVFGRR